MLGRLDFLVVQDMYATTETAQLAHLVLPAAGWGEKEGTFINSERRIGLTKKVARAPGEALADFQIFRLVAEAWGCGEMFRDWSSPEAVFQIIKELSRGQPCDITGIRDYQALDERGRHPVAASRGGRPLPDGERRLFEDGVFFHPDGSARLLFDAPAPAARAALARTTRWCCSPGGAAPASGTPRPAPTSPAVLRRLSPAELYVEINPADARDARHRARRMGRRSARPRGTVRARAFVTQAVQAGPGLHPHALRADEPA